MITWTFLGPKDEEVENVAFPIDAMYQRKKVVSNKVLSKNAS